MPLEDFIDRTVKNVIYDNNLGRSNIPIISSAVTEILGSPVATGLVRNKNVVPPHENENSIFTGSKLVLGLVQEAINASGVTVVKVNPTITYSKAGSKEGTGDLVSLGANLLSGGTVDVLGTLGLTGNRSSSDKVFRSRSTIDDDKPGMKADYRNNDRTVLTNLGLRDGESTAAWMEESIDTEITPPERTYDGLYQNSEDLWEYNNYEEERKEILDDPKAEGSLAKIREDAKNDKTVLTYSQVFGNAENFELGDESQFMVIFEKMEQTDSEIPETPFPKIAPGWMPVTQISVDRTRVRTNQIDLIPGVKLPIPLGFEYTLSLSTTFADSDNRDIYRYFDKYLKAMTPQPYQALPYKNACIRLKVYILNRQRDKVFCMNLYGFPTIEQNFVTPVGGSNPVLIRVSWNIVGEDDFDDRNPNPPKTANEI